MPSTNTITAFHTFVAKTRARASHVNTNFDNLRGHFLPINTDTATASHQTHNLGSSDHQWDTIYLKSPPVIGGDAPKFHIPILYDGEFPTDITENINALDRTSFGSVDTSGVAFKFVVPNEYTAGNRMSLSLRGYCETATSHFSMELGSSLFKDSVTAADLTLPSNSFTSTSDIQPAIANTMFVNTSLRITTADGKINGITVTAGDVVACYLNRTPSATADTNTGYFFLTNVIVDLNN